MYRYNIHVGEILVWCLGVHPLVKWELIMSQPCGMVLVPGNSELDIITQLCWNFNIKFEINLFDDCYIVYIFGELQYWFIRFILVKNEVLPMYLFYPDTISM